MSDRGHGPFFLGIDVDEKAEIALVAIEPELKRIRQNQPDIAVHLSADQASNYGLVAKVMSAVDRAGVSKLSMLTVND